MSTSSLPPATSSAVEQITPYLAREWSHDKRIVIFTLRNLSFENIDACTKLLQETLAVWPPDQPFLMLFDALFKDVTVTPYLKSRLGAVIESHQNLSGRTALVMQKSFLVSLGQFFLRGRKPGSRQRQIFYTREEGMAWLEELLVGRTSG